MTVSVGVGVCTVCMSEVSGVQLPLCVCKSCSTGSKFIRLLKSFTSNPSILSLSFRWSDHEKAVGALARRLGFTQVSLSSEVMPMVRAVPRGYTVCADAYLTPKIRQYLKGFTSGFKGGLKVCNQHDLLMWNHLMVESRSQCRLSDQLLSDDVLLFPLSSGCGRPVHAVGWRSDSHAAVLWFQGRSVWPGRRSCGIRHHLLQPDGEETGDWL